MPNNLRRFFSQLTQSMAVLCALLCFTSVSAQPQQPVSAFVDRTDISLNDVITLTIRIDAAASGSLPSLSLLNNDFDQLGISRNSTYTNSNGNVVSWNEYRISIRPRRAGTLTIPAFRIGSHVTNPITINVTDQPLASGSGNSEIFLETEVSKSSVYVQEQLIYTIRLFYTISFDQGAQLGSPEVDGAVIQLLGNDNTYQQVIDGIRYNVTERKFVIFPQSSGEIIIEPVTFNATLGRRGGLSRMLSNRTNVRAINLASDAHTIEVKGIPASFPGSTWLPASSISLEEEWSRELDNVEIGDAVTRNLTLVAEGLSSSLLPDFDYAEANGLKFYPDQPVKEDSASNNGVIGIRSEGAAIVPSMEGEFTIPGISIPWWNTETDQLEFAEVPEHIINVIAPANSPASLQPQAPLPGTPPAVSPEPVVTTVAVIPAWWIGLTSLLGLACLFSTFMWLTSRQSTNSVAAIMPASTAAENEQQALTARKAMSVLEMSCKQNNLLHIKRSLINWGQVWFDNPHIQTLQHLREYIGQYPTLLALVSSLEKGLYSEEAGQHDFRSQQLLEEVRKVQQVGKPAAGTRNEQKYALPPLYKN